MKEVVIHTAILTLIIVALMGVGLRSPVEGKWTTVIDLPSCKGTRTLEFKEDRTFYISVSPDVSCSEAIKRFAAQTQGGTWTLATMKGETENVLFEERPKLILKFQALDAKEILDRVKVYNFRSYHENGNISLTLYSPRGSTLPMLYLPAAETEPTLVPRESMAENLYGRYLRENGER
jgi:hypothetical protein